MNQGTIVPHYIDLRYPDGTHSGVRVDWARGIVEVRKRGTNYYFDVATLAGGSVASLAGTVDGSAQTCYNFNS